MFFHLIDKQEIYLIRRKEFVDPRFFLREIMAAPAAIDFCARWTANPMRAESFASERAVEEFKAQWLQRYTCEIIRITAK